MFISLQHAYDFPLSHFGAQFGTRVIAFSKFQLLMTFGSFWSFLTVVYQTSTGIYLLFLCLLLCLLFCLDKNVSQLN